MRRCVASTAVRPSLEQTLERYLEDPLELTLEDWLEESLESSPAPAAPSTGSGPGWKVPRNDLCPR
ncbi:hypothetical protein FXW78_09755 [Rhodococcus opacus]|nr:hypothetical protein [Rhodococcus opacus]